MPLYCRPENYQTLKKFLRFLKRLLLFLFLLFRYKEDLVEPIHLQSPDFQPLLFLFLTRPLIQMPKIILVPNSQHYFHQHVLKRDLTHFLLIEFHMIHYLSLYFLINGPFHLLIDLPKLQIDDHNNYDIVDETLREALSLIKWKGYLYLWELNHSQDLKDSWKFLIKRLNEVSFFF